MKPCSYSLPPAPLHRSTSFLTPKDLSLLARKLEAIEPSRNGLGLVAIEVDKVLSAAVELNAPAGNVEVGELALGGVLELDELGRSAEDVAVAAVNGAAGEARGDSDGNTVGGDSGVSALASLVVEDAESDLRNGDGDRGGGSRGAEGQDGSGNGGGELHFDGLKGWFGGLEVGELVGEEGSRVVVKM